MSDKDLYHKFFDIPAEANQKKQHELIDWSEIHKELRKKGVTLQLLWREYKETTPNGLGYTQFCLYHRRYAKNLNPVMRQTHTAGEKCFVDYAGATMSFINSETGEIVKAQIFVGCLGASSYTYAEATRSQKVQDWIGSNKRMFEFFGGVPTEVVPDNLKSCVKKADRYDPDLNPAYQEFGRYYNTTILPARAFSPRDKAAAESAVNFVTTKILAPLRNAQFYSLASLNEAIWERLKLLNHGFFQKKDTS